VPVKGISRSGRDAPLGLLHHYKYSLSKEQARDCIRKGADYFKARGYETVDTGNPCPYEDDVRARLWWEGFYGAEKRIDTDAIIRFHGFQKTR
jgi:hypothetical protein